MALFISMRKPLFTSICPWSLNQGTRNMTTLSGSVILSRMRASAYLGYLFMTGSTEASTSSTA